MKNFNFISVLVVVGLFAGCSVKPDEELVRQLNQIEYGFGVQDFHKAVEKGDIQAVRLFLDAGMDPEADSYKKRKLKRRYDPPLVIAAREGHMDIARLLLESGAGINRANRQNGTTPLIGAVNENPYNNQAEMVQFLLDEGAEIDTRDTHNGYTAFLYAAIRGNLKIMEMLIQNGADIDAVADNIYFKATALMLATEKGDQETTQWLVDRGADSGIRDKKQGTALDIARQKYKEEPGNENYAEIIQILDN